MFQNLRPVVRNDENNYRDKLTSIGWKNEFTINEAWSCLLYTSRCV